MNQSHKDKMEELKTEMSSKIKAADRDKGIILTLTGEGKGKSSSGFGMVMRSIGHGIPTAVLQFIKGSWKTGESEFCKKHDLVEYFAVGAGFTWDTQDKEKDIELVGKTWSKAEEVLSNPKFGLVLLDEVNVALHFGYLDLELVLSALRNKPENMHVVLTGRDAPEQITAISDTVSVISSPKHAFEQGIRAQKGIEF